MRDVHGAGKTAQMTYYETRRGARVFAAGAFTLAGAALQPDVSRVLENLWARLADEPFRSRRPSACPGRLRPRRRCSAASL